MAAFCAWPTVSETWTAGDEPPVVPAGSSASRSGRVCLPTRLASGRSTSPSSGRCARLRFGSRQGELTPTKSSYGGNPGGPSSSTLGLARLLIAEHEVSDLLRGSLLEEQGDGVGELDGVVESDRPAAAPSRSPSASWSACGCRHPTLRTRSFPSCPITGATHAVWPPGWKGSLRTSDDRSWSEATVAGSVGNQAARFSSPGRGRGCAASARCPGPEPGTLAHPPSSCGHSVAKGGIPPDLGLKGGSWPGAAPGPPPPVPMREGSSRCRGARRTRNPGAPRTSGSPRARPASAQGVRPRRDLSDES